MKKAKEIVSLLLVLAMVFSLAACSGQVGGGGSSANTPAPNTTDSGDGDTNVAPPVADGITMTTAPWYRGEMNVYQTEKTGFEKKDPDTVVIGSGNQIIGCDPLNSQDEYPWSHNVYESLIGRNTETGEAEPLLATEWGYDDEGNFHITLRENVKFHDGTILNAEDVIFTLKRNADNASSNINDACSKINFEKSYIEDDLNLVLVFDEPSSSFVSALQSGFAGILSKEFFDEHGEDYDFFEADAGTGAYTVIETVSGISQRFERFDDYWGEAPEFKYIECVLYKDYTTGCIDYINGDIDILQSINSYDSVMRFFNGEIDSTICYQLPVNRGIVLYLATGDGPCADENIRKAIAHCIDYESLAYGVFQGPELGTVGQSILLPGTKYAIDPGTYEYNPELAAEYLAEAGYDTENRLSLKVETSDGANNQAACEMIQYYCAQIGIDVECIFEKSAAMTAASNATEYQYDMIAYPMQYRSGHPAEALAGRDAYGKEPGTYAYIKGIQSEELHNLMSEGATCLDDDRANEIYTEIQQMFYDHVWTIPLTTSTSVIFCRDYLTGVTFPNGYGNLWKTIKTA